MKDFEACEQLRRDEREVLESIYSDQITFREQASSSDDSSSPSSSSSSAASIVHLSLPITLPRSPRQVTISSSPSSSSSTIGNSSSHDVHLQLRTLPPLSISILLPSDYPLYSPPSVLSISSPATLGASRERQQPQEHEQRLRRLPGGDSKNDEEKQEPNHVGTSSSYLSKKVTHQMRRKLSSDWAELAGVTVPDDNDAEDGGAAVVGSETGDGSCVLWTWLDWLGSGDFLMETCCEIVNVGGQDDVIRLISPDPASLAHLLQSHDTHSSLADFSATTFTCGICFESKKGRLCVPTGCSRGCVFCAGCLNDCWALAIKEGNVGAVACPGFECTKDRAKEDARVRDDGSVAGGGTTAAVAGDVETGGGGSVDENGTTPSIETLSSSSSISSVDVALVERVVGKSLAERYAWLVEKKRVENDPRYMMCPLPHCQAPVPPPPAVNPAVATPSAKRPRQVFRLPSAANAPPTPEVSPLAAAEAEEAARQRQVDQWDRYRQCPTCRFSFCRYCQATWHGPHLPCKIAGADSFLIKYMSLEDGDPVRATFERRYGKKNLARLVAEYVENEANRRWIESNTQTCPSCSSRIEHSHGCQHMSCATCGSHFYPYVHYNDPRSGCYGKLFDAAEIARFDRIMAAGGDEDGQNVRDDVPWAAIGGGMDDIVDMI